MLLCGMVTDIPHSPAVSANSPQGACKCYSLTVILQQTFHKCKQKSGDIPAFRIFREVPSFSYPISTRTAAAEVRNITASAQSEAGMV